MKTIYVFEPAMRCSTGLCGPTYDPELLRMSFIMKNLKNSPIESARFNLSINPDVFVQNTAIKELLENDGIEALPATYVDGNLMVKGRYPTTHQFSEWSGISEEELIKKPRVRLSRSVKGNF